MKSYIIRTIIIALVATPVYLLIRRPWRCKDKREWALAVFFVYLLCLGIFTLEGTYSTPLGMISSALDRIRTGQGINLVPFRTIKGFFAYATPDEFMVNIVSNVVIFIPWGFLLPLLWDTFKSVKNHLAMCIGITVFIELFQLLICRNTDVDDIILNFLGGVLGGALYWCVSKIVRKSNDEKYNRE